MQTGENEQALRQILDFIRFTSIFILLMHFYAACYPAWQEWHLTNLYVDKIIFNLSSSLTFLNGVYKPKIFALGLLSISILGTKGKKDDKLTPGSIAIYLITGLAIYFFSVVILNSKYANKEIAVLYTITTTAGFLLYLQGAAKAGRYLRLKFRGDV